MSLPVSRFELISFELCPYVQRSVITLLQKKVDFKLTYINLATPPEWFTKISPLGKVPVLLVRDDDISEPVVLFESAVINEYIDEIAPPMLLADDPLGRARQRAWITVADEILVIMHTMVDSSDLAKNAEAKDEMFEILARTEEALGDGPYFSGEQFSLVDAAFAPVFMRLDLFKIVREDSTWEKLHKTRRWADALMTLPYVIDSVVPDFAEKFAAYMHDHGGAWADQILVKTAA